MKSNIKTLGEITSYISKGIVPKYTLESGKNTIRVLNQRCNRNNEITLGPSRLNDVTKRRVPENKILRINDVLVNSTGVGTAGRVAQITKINEQLTVDGHMIILRPNQSIDPVFYGYLVKANQYKIEQLAEGSTGQTEINRDRLLNEIICQIPPVEDQITIAYQLRRLDLKIKINKQINANLLELAKIVFEETVKKSEYKHLSELVEVKDGTHDSPKQQSKGYPLVTSKAIKGMSIDFSQLKLISKQDFNKINERSLVEHGDILFSMIGTVGLVYKVIENPINYAIKNVGLIKTHSSNYSNLVYLSLISHNGISYVKSHMSGSTQQFLSLTNLRNFPIPSITQEQLKSFNHQVDPIFGEIESIVHQNNSLNKLKKVLLSKLLN